MGTKSRGIERAVPGATRGFPSPQGENWNNTVDTIESSLNALHQSNKSRIKYGKIANRNIIISLRIITGMLMALSALSGVIAPGIIFATPSLTVLFWIPMLFLSITPAFVSAEKASSALILRSALWKQGEIQKGIKRDMMAEPGMDRIKTGINDVRISNGISSILAATAVLLLLAAGGLEPNTLAYNMLLLIAMAFSLSLSFHAIFITDHILKLGDEMPYLILHSPTHHPTQLDTIMGDIILSHLDPDLVAQWGDWEKKLANSLLPGVDSRQARERILYLMHLNLRGNLSDLETIDELKEFIKYTSISDLLLNPKGMINWRTIQRLIRHAKSWREDVFNLLDRLQNDLMAGASTITESEWRMDIALSPYCGGGAGDLFIALNNQTSKNRHMRVEVIVPGGKPQSHTHRLELSACPAPSGPLKITDPLVDDALDWMPRYLEKGIILWIGVCWEKTIRGERNVQIILRDDEGIVVDSRVIRTTVTARDNYLNSRRLNGMLKARTIGESPIPIIEDMTLSA
ncbi:MAG: hypothetical protein QGI21_05100 [Candidatus Poseidoniaceae archaeon]|jgi:hypothetical protein|nr:hypothetical protein [Candidatus Poseidoniaceae archaeon]